MTTPRRPGQKRSREQRLYDQRRIAELRLKRCTQQEIADEVEVSPATVKRSLRKIEDEWREAAKAAIDEYKMEELARLEQMERELWAQWAASKQEQTKRIVEEKQGGRQVRLETTTAVGEPRFMTLLVQISQRRSSLLGLDSPQKVASTTPDGGEASPGATLVLPPTAPGVDEWLRQYGPSGTNSQGDG